MGLVFTSIFWFSVYAQQNYVGWDSLVVSGNDCPGQAKTINVLPTLPTPVAILGEIRVCPGTPYTYNVPGGTGEGTELVWSASSGVTFLGTNTGDSVTVIFGVSPANHTLFVKRIPLDGSVCHSKLAKLEISNITSFTPSISGDDVFCPSTTTTFSVGNLGAIVPDLIEWSVKSTVNNDPNFGNVIDGLNGNTVTISWNEISTSPTGIVTVKVYKCGQIFTGTKTVTLSESPSIWLTSVPASLCPESGNFNVTLNSSNPPLSSGTVVWDYGGGVTYSTAVIPGSSQSYSLPNYFSNMGVVDVTATLTVTVEEANGCFYTPMAFEEITLFPETMVDIEEGYNHVVCPEDYTGLTLTADVTSGTGVSVGYQWYKNEMSISGATNAQYSITPATQGTSPGGTYYVKVTDSNGCVVYSAEIFVQESCTEECPDNFDPATQLTLEWEDCNVFEAQLLFNNPNNYPVSIVWSASGGALLQSGQGTTTATFYTDITGEHLITATLTFTMPSGDCTISYLNTITKHYRPDFNYVISCNPVTETYDVSLSSSSALFVATGVSYTFDDGTTTYSTPTVLLSGLAPGNYLVSLTLNMTGEEPCTITKNIELPQLPNINFSLTPLVYCAEEVIMLSIPDYNPINTYTWFFDGTSFIASSANTPVNISEAGNYEISLEASNPYGCAKQSTETQVLINKAEFDGFFNPVGGINVCVTQTPYPSISFSGGEDNPAMPSGYIWMRGNEYITTTTTNSYTPLVSGSYWAKLIDANGCIFSGMAAAPVNVIIRSLPFVALVGDGVVCDGESGSLTAIVTDNTLHRRWLLDGNPISPALSNWSPSVPLTIPIDTGTAGSFDYTFQVRPYPLTSPACGNSATMTVTVNPPVDEPLITYDVITCEPYKVKLTAAGPVSGTYNWSNGDTGKTIEVFVGGGYGVVYTETTGCTASSQITIPHPAERSLWIFPEGCYEVCLLDEPLPYIIGPFGIYDAHSWLINGVTVQSDTDVQISPQPVSQAGTYQLHIENDGCVYESGLMHIAPPNAELCEIQPCEPLDFIFDVIGYDSLNDCYKIKVSVYNAYGYPVTVTFSSFNNYGTFSPSSMTIPPGSYTYPTFICFTPNSSFTGNGDFIMVQMEDCLSLWAIDYMNYGARLMAEGAQAVFWASPNPVLSEIGIHYDLGEEYQKAESLVLYSIQGRELMRQPLQNKAGEAVFDMAHLPSGTYVLSLTADGKRVWQQQIIKK